MGRFLKDFLLNAEQAQRLSSPPHPLDEVSSEERGGILKNISDFSAVNEVYGLYFKNNSPTRSTVQMANLPKDALGLRLRPSER
jgi:hypothetical protein